MFKNFTIFTRLMILTGVMILALFLNLAIGWLGFRAATAGVEDVYQGSVEEAAYLFNMRSLYEVNIVNTIQKVRDGLLSWKEGEEAIDHALNKIEVGWTEYLELINQDHQGQHKLVSSLMNQIENLQYLIKNSKLPFEKLRNIFRQQDHEALVIFATQEMYSLIDPITSAFLPLIDWHFKETKEDYKVTKSTLLFYQILRTSVFVIALIISLIIAALITSSITKPLKSAVEAIKRIASGDLKDEIFGAEENSSKEIGELFQAMKKMVDSNKKIAEALALFSIGELNLQVEPRSEKDILSKALNDMISSSKKITGALTALTNGDLNVNVPPRSDCDVLGLALVSMTKKLRQMIGHIQTDVVSLNDSSQEIMISVSQVATGSTETATAVAETTTTIEELKQTAHVSAEKAKDVLMSAEETLQIVKSSEKSLQSTIEDMNQINEKMHIISDGIIKLSELSQTIREIIDTVNDLAEQSNLLAVNAAIEAAKAGEQGKGFGVVAQEIRTLAEQSKAATIQVRAILNDIQNATSAAVLATEQGSKAVEKGVSRSSQTNESMRILVASMAHVTQSANQITISSQQQLVGVEQVMEAIHNINEAANQHAENMKKIENAIFALNSIGNTLKKITDQYTLGELESLAINPQKNSLSFENDKKESHFNSPQQTFSI